MMALRLLRPSALLSAAASAARGAGALVPELAPTPPELTPSLADSYVRKPAADAEMSVSFAAAAPALHSAQPRDAARAMGGAALWTVTDAGAKAMGPSAVLLRYDDPDRIVRGGDGG